MKLIKIIKEMENDVKEAGYSSVGQTLRGLRSTIHTVAILTAHNPCGKVTDNETNNKRNQELKRDLKDGLYGYRPAVGDYGTIEDSFIINNITKEDAIKLGNRYDQETIIFGEKFEEDGKSGMRFDLIQTSICNEESPEIGTVNESRKVFINADNFKEFFTIVKGRKFRIPFYDEDYQYADWDGGKINKNPKPLSEEDTKLLESYTRYSLEENRTSKSKWEYRGKIKKIYQKYLLQ